MEEFGTTGGLLLEDYATPEEKLRDRHFQEYKARKYQGANMLDTFEYEAPKTVDSNEVDRIQFEQAQNNFAKRSEIYHDIRGFENWGMAWDMNNARDAELKDYGALANGEITLEEVRQRNDERLNKIATERGLTRDDLSRWEQKKYKGFIWGLSDTVNDLRDAASKSGLITAGYVTVGAIGGALIGFSAGGVGAIPGAILGAELGLQAAQITALPAGVLWDTAEKEAASSFKKFVDAKPNATEEEFKRAKQEAAINGLIDGGLETGAAMLFASYGAKIAARIPGINKVAAKLTAKDEAEVVKSLKSAFSGEAGKEFVASIGRNMGVEFTQEEAQNLLDHVSEYRMGILEKEDMTPEALTKEALETASVVGQKSFLLAAVGAGADVRSRVSNTAEVLNKKIEANNAEYELPEEQKKALRDEKGTFQLKVTKEEVVSMPDANLEQAEKENNYQVKKIEAQEAMTQTQIKNAEGLGLDETEVSTLEKTLADLQTSKEEAVAALREIGTERAIRQAIEETDNTIEKTTSELEKVNSDLDSLENKIQEYETSEKDTTKLIARKTKLESKISELETQRETYISEKNQLEARENVESILEGKQTTIPSKTLVDIEKKAKKEIQDTKEKSQIKINKTLEKYAKQKVNDVIKNAKIRENAMVKGYLTGAKEQARETKDVNKMLTKALTDAGIKRSEIGVFDGIKSRVVTLSDLVANKKNIENKIGEVFEKRNKEAALKDTLRLKKLSRPFKGGKNPKGKMTPQVQAKLDRMFSFTDKSALEAGFDVEDLVDKFSNNPDAELSVSEKAKAAIAQNNATIRANQEEINALKDTKQTPKTKWNGLSKDRSDIIEPTEEEIKANVKEIKIGEPKEPGDFVERIKKEAYKAISKSLNIINMGFTFENLTVDIDSSAFDAKNFDENFGLYNRFKKTIIVKKNGNFSIPHEMGHYFDNLLGEMISGKEGMDFSDMKNFDNPALKKTVNKMQTLMKAEALRVKSLKGFNKLEETQKEYLLSEPETFARIFNSIYNKASGYENTKIDFMSELTKTVPDKTISSFKSLLNELADYKATGGRVFELQQGNQELEAQNAKILANASEVNKQGVLDSLPAGVADLIHEIDLASDLKNRSSEDIIKFNNYVANLIQTGRDARAEKLAQRKAEKENSIKETVESLAKFAPTTRAKLGAKAMGAYNTLFANWESYLNSFFGSEAAKKFSVRRETIDREVFVSKEREKLVNELIKVGDFKNRTELNNYIHGLLKETDKYVKNVDDIQILTELSSLNILDYYILNKNSENQEILNNLFGEELPRMFGKLDERDKLIGDKLQEFVGDGRYYEMSNAVFSDLYDIDMPQNENYFPRSSEKEVPFIEQLAGQMAVGGRTPSYFKSRTAGRKADLIARNPFNVAFEHIEQTGDTVFLLKRMNEINQVFNDKKVTQSIKATYGQQAAKEFAYKIKDMTLQTRMAKRLKLTNLLDKWVSNAIVAKIALKPVIAVKQMLSYINYAEGMPVSEFLKYNADFLSNPKKAIDFMMESEYLKVRFSGGQQTLELASAIETSRFSKTRSLIDFLSLNLRVGDIGAIIFGGYSKVKYLMNEEGLSKKEALARFEKETSDAQQYASVDSVSNLQEWGRANAMARFVFAFKNAQNQYVRKVGDATIKFSRGEISKGEYSKALAIYAVLNPWFYNMATSLSLLQAFGNTGDEDGEGLKNVITDLVGGVAFGNIDALPIFGDVISDVGEYAVTGKKYPADTLMFIEELTKAGFSTIDMVKALTDEDVDPSDIDFAKFFESFIGVGELTTGLPIESSKNMIEGLSQIINNESSSQGTLRTLGYTKKASSKYTD